MRSTRSASKPLPRMPAMACSMALPIMSIIGASAGADIILAIAVSAKSFFQRAGAPMRSTRVASFGAKRKAAS